MHTDPYPYSRRRKKRPLNNKENYRPLDMSVYIPLGPGFIHGAVNPLVDLQQLQVEGQLRIAWHPCHSLLAVCEIGWDDDATLTACLHTCNANVPTFDD